MALEHDSWAVAGADSSPRIARLQLQSGTASGNGVVATDHLQVQELDVPGTSVRVTSGGATILGQELEFQGSYFAFNVGDAEIPISPTGSGGGRSDLIVLRVEDPGIDGTSWVHDPATDPVYYFRVIEGVSSTETEAPAGSTAIPLARIDIPVSTATITQDMITDVRQLANPKRQRVLRVQRGGTQTGGEWDEAGNIQDPDSERWPQHDWSVTIPTWATQVQILADWTNVFLKPTGATGGANDAIGQLFVGLVGGPDGPLYTENSAYNFNQTSTTNGYRCSASNKDQIPIPADWRGLTVDVRMYVMGNDGQSGRLVADGWANFSVDMEFLEVAAPEAEL